MTGELDGQVTSEAIGALGNDRPDLQGDADQPVRYVEVPRKAESAEALAAAADASLGHCRAGIGQGELGHAVPGLFACSHKTRAIGAAAGADPPGSKRGSPFTRPVFHDF